MRRLVAALSVFLFLPTCADSTSPPVPVPTSVTVSPGDVTLAAGGATGQLTATVHDQNGAVMAGATVAWSSSDGSVASVSPQGVVTPLDPGMVTVTAAAGTASGTAEVMVLPPPAASVQVTPAEATILAGELLQLTAAPKDAAGNVLTGRIITWSSTQTQVASVDLNGLVTGISAGGPVLVTAHCEGVSGTALVTVLPPPVSSIEITPHEMSLVVGGSIQLTATPRDAGGTVLAGRTVTWASSDPTVATVNASGLVFGVSEGPVTITATSEGVTGSASITAKLPELEVAFDVNAPAKVGVLYQPTPRIRVLFEGDPLGGYAVDWEPVDDVSGWVFPLAESTDPEGYAEAHWIPGSGGRQKIRARGVGVSSILTFDVEPWPSTMNGAGVWMGPEVEVPADGFRVTLNAAEDPYATYYCAMQIDGAYFGYQSTTAFDPTQPVTVFHNPFEKLVLFSVWDSPEVGIDAVLLEQGVAECRDFEENGGYGVQCTLPYPWLTGEPYTFEIQQTDGPDFTEYAAYFTDVSSGDRMLMARVRRGPSFNISFAPWIEDFGLAVPSCLDVELRDVTVTDPFRRVNGVWEPLTRVLLENPINDRCANHSITKAGNGVRLTGGGSIVQAPFSRWFMLIP